MRLNELTAATSERPSRTVRGKQIGASGRWLAAFCSTCGGPVLRREVEYGFRRCQ
jgi:hypothetical protein